MTLLILLSGLHSLLFFTAGWNWRRIKSLKTPPSTDGKFTILIPVRNEASNILQLLGDLEAQTYPTQNFEVIVLDDHSEDTTAALVEEFRRHSHLQIRVFPLPPEHSGKKWALTQGVSLARYPFIITTDGDCRVGVNWVSTYAGQFKATNSKMLVGPVKMSGQSFFERLQIVEFGALIGFGGAALRSGNPSMCNGANLAYERAVFHEVQGYEGNLQIPSGDDEFLLQKVFAKYSDRVSFVKDKEAIVATPAKESLSAFINQRIRWSGKWKYHKSRFVHVLALVVFFDYLSVLIGLCLTIAGKMPPELWAGLMLLRYASEASLAWPVSRFLRIRSFFFESLAIQIIYPVCVSFLGFASIFGHYSWKGRSYK